jgi:hypothetical protein
MIATYLTRGADDAYEAVRVITHNMIGVSCPASVAHDVLGSLKLLGPALGQALARIGEGLSRSSEVHAVNPDDGGDPVRRVAQAVDLLGEAGEHAKAVGVLLDRVQSTISTQDDLGHGGQDRRPGCSPYASGTDGLALGEPA